LGDCLPGANPTTFQFTTKTPALSRLKNFSL
jgi:hypothetical protein